jgi:hypothetical protein
MKTVKCVKGYYDTKLNRQVKPDEEFEVTDERATQLIKAKVSVEVATPTPTPEKVATPKTRKKKEA